MYEILQIVWADFLTFIKHPHVHVNTHTLMNWGGVDGGSLRWMLEIAQSLACVKSESSLCYFMALQALEFISGVPQALLGVALVAPAPLDWTLHSQASIICWIFVKNGPQDPEHDWRNPLKKSNALKCLQKTFKRINFPLPEIKGKLQPICFYFTLWLLWLSLSPFLPCVDAVVMSRVHSLGCCTHRRHILVAPTIRMVVSALLSDVS